MACAGELDCCLLLPPSRKQGRLSPSEMQLEISACFLSATLVVVQLAHNFLSWASDFSKFSIESLAISQQVTQ